MWIFQVWSSLSKSLWTIVGPCPSILAENTAGSFIAIPPQSELVWRTPQFNRIKPSNQEEAICSQLSRHPITAFEGTLQFSGEKFHTLLFSSSKYFILFDAIIKIAVLVGLFSHSSLKVFRNANDLGMLICTSQYC